MTVSDKLGGYMPNQTTQAKKAANPTSKSVISAQIVPAILARWR